MRTLFHCTAALLVSQLLAGSAVAGPAPDPAQLLRTRPTGMDEDEWRKQRRDAARELGDERSEEAVDALIDVVETERYDAVLSIAMDSLARIGNPRAIPALQKVYADRSIDSFVREDAAKAIRALGGTPQDDARLTGKADSGAGPKTERVVQGPQLGVMGEASAPEDTFEDTSKRKRKQKPLPANLRARDRDIGFVVGALDIRVNTLSDETPMFANAGLGAFADYVDERDKWGWNISSSLNASYRNGDVTASPDPADPDDGDLQFIQETLAASAGAHYYFGKTDFHVFGQLGVSQRLAVITAETVDGGPPDETSDTRFALDVTPAAGFGWGRYLNAGSDIMVDAIVRVLEQENILARPLDDAARKAIRDAVYRYSNAFSTYPRVASVVQVLQDGGFLARRAGARLLYRLRSVVEDPSFLNRMQGIRARVGFLWSQPVAQDDFFRRANDPIGAPFLQFEAGFQLDRERQVTADLRGWYDIIDQGGFTADAGARYTRFLHSEFDDYRGQWFAGLRGGASLRQYDLPDGAPDEVLGYRAVAQAGYAYGFQRGSEIGVAVNAGVDSGGFVVGAGLALRFGIARGSVLNARGGTGAKAAPENPAPETSGDAKADGASGTTGGSAGAKVGGKAGN